MLMSIFYVMVFQTKVWFVQFCSTATSSAIVVMNVEVALVKAPSECMRVCVVATHSHNGAFFYHDKVNRI